MATAALKQHPENRCRFCGTSLPHSFIDLGSQPPSNSYLRPADLTHMELFFPLHAFVCGSCHLVQLEAFQSPEDIFSDYAYFSSYSESWLRHAEVYCAAMIERFGFDETSQVVEIASNDGYLLQYFAKRNIPVLGVEPAANDAEVAEVDPAHVVRVAVRERVEVAAARRHGVAGEVDQRAALAPRHRPHPGG